MSDFAGAYGFKCHNCGELDHKAEMHECKMTALEELLKKSAALREKATAGPWERITSGHLITRTGHVNHEWNHGTKGTTDIICKPSIEHNVGADDESNFIFIAHSRNTSAAKDEIISVLVEALSRVKHNNCCLVCSPNCPACNAYSALFKVDKMAEGALK